MSTVERRRDAALALALAALVVGFAPVPAAPLPAVAGVLGTLAIEWALSRRAPAVRRVWARGWVRVTAFVGTVLVAALLAARLGPAVWTLVVAGCATYLVVLVGVELRERR
jgi:hypothetical protein